VSGIGSSSTRLIVLRSNSGAGKSTIARTLRSRLSGCVAWVEQDYLRRIVLRDHAVPDGRNIGLISNTVRYALDDGCDVILEGTLFTARYSTMLEALGADHRGQTLWYWFNISLDETLRRHTTRPQAAEFSADAMRGWFCEWDPLNFANETIIPEAWSISEAVERILADLSRYSPRMPDRLDGTYINGH
jgi:hypothetical protein